MSYIENTLMSDEKLIYRSKPHWIVFANSMIWGTCMLIAYTIGPFTEFGSWSIFNYKVYNLFGMLAFFLAIAAGVSSYITYVTSEYGITNKRVLIKVGFIRRASLEVLLSKVESIQVLQSIPGRMFGYGTIIIVGTGGSRDAYRNIPDPLKFRNITQEEVDDYEEGHG